jgi:hypothetical protein
MILIDELKEKHLVEGVRHFVDFPEVIFFDDFYDHVEDLYGAEIMRFEIDGTIGMWLEFIFREHKFFVTNDLADYQFYVEDEKCPEEILLEIAAHFRRLLEKDETEVQELDGDEM